MFRLVLIPVVLWAVLAPSSVSAATVFIPPVDAPIAVRFVQPQHAWGPGHRGIDYVVPAGTSVRAAAAGIVTFAGPVAGRLAVTLSHAFAYETTYTALDEISVARGQRVTQGTYLGRSDRAHLGGDPGLHFGVKLRGAYVDPAALLGDLDVSDAIHLAPLVWQPPAGMPDAFTSAFADAGTAQPLCRPAPALAERPAVAPNENVAVAIAGISSSTRGGLDADMYEHGPEELGYPPERVYRFSYAGTGGPRLHRPYDAGDTWGDISDAAALLRETLVQVARRHPGARVDLIAHSMGGLVARRFLAALADLPAPPAPLPQIEHLVTFASPHEGSSLATIPAALEDNTLSGDLLVRGLSAWARHGGRIPDPRSEVVNQLRPRSELLTELAQESVVYGTRVLAIGIPNDLIVTADRSAWGEARFRVVPPEGLAGHSAIVASDDAQGLAYAFLRDAPPSCETAWDLWGPRLGRAAGLIQEQSYRAVEAAEATALGRILGVGRAVDGYGGGRVSKVAQELVEDIVHRAAVQNRPGAPDRP